MKNMNNMNKTASEILDRASKVAGEAYAVNPELIAFMWNENGNETTEIVRNAVLCAQAYAKQDADAYAKIAGIDPVAIYSEIDGIATTRRDTIREKHFDKIMAQTEFNQNGRLFHVIGRVLDMTVKLVKNRRHETMRLLTVGISYRNDEENHYMRLTVWEDKVDNAFATFKVDDIITVNGSINKHVVSRKPYINYTVRNFTMFAEADPLAYAPSPVYYRNEDLVPSERKYDVSIWGRRGHWRRTPKTREIIYIRPCVCHRRQTALAQSIANVAIEYEHENA